MYFLCVVRLPFGSCVHQHTSSVPSDPKSFALHMSVDLFENVTLAKLLRDIFSCEVQ